MPQSVPGRTLCPARVKHLRRLSHTALPETGCRQVSVDQSPGWNGFFRMTIEILQGPAQKCLRVGRLLPPHEVKSRDMICDGPFPVSGCQPPDAIDVIL